MKTLALWLHLHYSPLSQTEEDMRQVLKENYGAREFVLKSVEEDGLVHGLISFTGEEGPYILVAKYDSRVTIDEYAPSKMEMEEWDKL